MKPAQQKPTPAPAADDGAAKLSRSKKAAFSVIVLVGLLAVLEVVLALGGIDPVSVTQDPYVGFRSASPLFVPSESGVVETAAKKLRFFNHQSFRAAKEPDTFRIFCLGGSTTFGRPYDDRTSFAGWLRAFLAAADPSRKWEVINAGGISYASYRVTALMEDLNRYEPDLYIVYSGHNEFLERRTYQGIIEEHSVVTAVNLALYRSRIYSALVSAKRRLAPAGRDAARQRYELTGEVQTMLDTTVGLDNYRRDDELAVQVLDHYRYNLGRMAALARAAGAGLVFVTTPANLRDFSPFKSENRAGLTAEELTRWQGLVGRAESAMEQDDSSAAAAALAEALALDDRYARTHFDLGRALLAVGRHEEAGAAFKRAVEEDVAPLRALPAMRSTIAEVGRRHDVPVIDFEAMLKERCRARAGHAILGSEDFLDHVHPTIEATGLLARALLDHLVAAGTVTPRSEWNDARAAEVGEALVGALTERDHALAARTLATVLDWAGKDEESARLLATAIEALPDDAGTLRTQAELLLDRGKIDEAIELLRRAVRLAPDYARAHGSLGCALDRRGDVDEAMAHYRIAIRLDPEHVVAHANLGKHLAERGEWGEAVSRFRTVARIEPHNAKPQTDLAVALGRAGKIEEASVCFRRAIELAPADATIRRHFGVALVEGGRVEDAIEQLRQALNLLPDDPATLANLAWAFGEANQVDEAIRYSRRALARDPALVGVRGRLGGLLAERGAFAEAAAVWRKGLEHSPRSVSLANALGLLLATCPRRELRNGDEAVRLAEQANGWTEGRHPRVLHTLAAAHAERGDFRRAIASAQRAQTLARAAGDVRLSKEIGARLSAYRIGQNP